MRILCPWAHQEEPSMCIPRSDIVRGKVCLHWTSGSGAIVGVLLHSGVLWPCHRGSSLPSAQSCCCTITWAWKLSLWLCNLPYNVTRSTRYRHKMGLLSEQSTRSFESSDLRDSTSCSEGFLRPSGSTLTGAQPSVRLGQGLGQGRWTPGSLCFSKSVAFPFQLSLFESLSV